MRRFLIDHGGASAAVSVWVMRTNFARVGGSVTITEDVQAAGKMTPANAGRIELWGSDTGQTGVRPGSDTGLTPD